MDDFKIISFCSFDYVEVAKNWVQYLSNHNIENYVIVALDTETYNHLLKQKINTKLVHGEILKRSGTGWKFRFQTMYEMLKDGNILHCDLDAIWLKDARNLLDDEHDIIASMDKGGWPPKAFEHLDFTMCMGWIFFRNNDNVKSIFEKILEKESDFDDQEEFNEYIIDNLKSNHIFIKNENERILEVDDVKVRVLNETDVFRGNYNEASYVCHPLIKKQANKQVQLKKRGLWYNGK